MRQESVIPLPSLAQPTLCSPAAVDISAVPPVTADDPGPTIQYSTSIDTCVHGSPPLKTTNEHKNSSPIVNYTVMLVLDGDGNSLIAPRWSGDIVRHLSITLALTDM